MSEYLDYSGLSHYTNKNKEHLSKLETHITSVEQAVTNKNSDSVLASQALINSLSLSTGSSVTTAFNAVKTLISNNSSSVKITGGRSSVNSSGAFNISLPFYADYAFYWIGSGNEGYFTDSPATSLHWVRNTGSITNGPYVFSSGYYVYYIAFKYG